MRLIVDSSFSESSVFQTVFRPHERETRWVFSAYSGLKSASVFLKAPFSWQITVDRQDVTVETKKRIACCFHGGLISEHISAPNGGYCLHSWVLRNPTYQIEFIIVDGSEEHNQICCWLTWAISNTFGKISCSQFGFTRQTPLKDSFTMSSSHLHCISFPGGGGTPIWNGRGCSSSRLGVSLRVFWAKCHYF